MKLNALNLVFEHINVNMLGKNTIKNNAEIIFMGKQRNWAS
jgi:hypothetical protein